MMSHFPQTVSLRTLVIVSTAVFSVTSLTWYLATKNRRVHFFQSHKRKNIVSDSQHHSKYPTKEILTHKLRSYKTFLEAIRNGDIESAVQYGEQNEISNFIAIITGILAQIPFGAEWFRSELSDLFVKRCQQNIFLLQSFHFFINSYFNEDYVKHIWSSHPIYRLIHRNNINALTPPSDSTSRPSSKYRGKKPKMVEIQSQDLIVMRRQRQNHLLHLLYNSLLDDNHQTTRRHSKRTKKGFKLSPKSMLQKVDKRKKSKGCTFIVNEIEYEGDNVLRLFEIFTFAYMDEDSKEHKDDDIYDKIAIKITPGFKVNIICKNNIFCDPINGNSNMNTIQVQSVFNSKTKPLLLSLYCNERLSSQMVFKKGDDLRKDASIVTMFHLFNDIWKLNEIKYKGIPIETVTYRCVPMGADYGCIEYVAECIPLTDIKKCYANKVEDETFVNKLIATSVGSYIGAFIMGIRDRHSDNILIKKDGTLFHIDFGYVLGEKLSGLDASKFAITNDLQSVMGDEGWDEFVDYCVSAFLKLRDNHKDILSFGKTALRFLEWNKIEAFLKQQLMIGADHTEVEQYMKEKINKAPNKWKTRMKNIVHKAAINIKNMS